MDLCLLRMTLLHRRFLIACGCAALQEEAHGAQKELAKLRAELALAKSASLASEAVRLDSGAQMLVARLDGADNKSLQAITVLLMTHGALTVALSSGTPSGRRWQPCQSSMKGVFHYARV